MVIIDSCHAAGMASSKDELEKKQQVPLFSKILSGFEEKAYPKISGDDWENGEGIAVFTSSKGSESSWIRGDKGISIYTDHLIEALEEKGNRRSNNNVKVSNFRTYLSEKVPESAKKHWKAEQTPKFDLHNADDFTNRSIKEIGKLFMVERGFVA
ncbi:caspase family protein [Dapis sp. BLCC M229]|uniref:caspase family protein n=1 Tax=Dapis sp. BLCC M229 TaxID=3400188 RepID=UPI003CEFE9E9